MKSKAKFGIIILLLLILNGFIYASSYTISEENVKLSIANNLSLADKNINLIKEENLSGLKTLIFINENEPAQLGLAILAKGINNKYKILGVYNDSDKYVTARKRGLKNYIIIAGNNSDGALEYLKFNDNNTKIKIEKGLFLKVLNIESGQVYNYYNEDDEVIEWN